MLSLSHLQAEVKAIERDIINNTAVQHREIDIMQYQELNAVCGYICSQDHSIADESVDIVNSLIDNVGGLEFNQASTSLASHKDKGMILMTYLTFANWMMEIRSGIQNYYGRDLADIPSNERWIAHLTSDVRTAITTRTPSKTFRASSYVACDAIANQESTMDRSTKLLFLIDDDIIKNTTISEVMDIIEGWIGIERRTKQPRWKLLLLRFIYEAFGVQALALEGTWKIFSTATPIKVSGKSHKKTLSADDMVQFRQALTNHPLANPISSESFNALVIFNYKNRGWATGDFTKGSMNSPLRPQRLARVVAADDTIAELRMVRREYFRIYVEGAISAVNEYADMSNGSEDQKRIMADPEQFCPFRECTPSWSALTGSDGPYHSDTISTAPGLFSTVLLAAFGLQLVPGAKHLFNNYDEWREHHQHQPPYILAYTWNENKDSLAKHWWSTILKSNWHQVAGPTLPYAKLHDFLVHNLRDIGVITAMNIASDLALAGACCTPTGTELAKVLHASKSANKTTAAIKYLNGLNSTQPLEDKSVIAQTLDMARLDMVEIMDEGDQSLIGCITLPTVQYCLSKFAKSALF